MELDEPPRSAGRRSRLWLPAVLALVAAALFGTRVDGVFTIDEYSYLSTVVALRGGGLTLPATAGLPPSPELLSFEAAPRARAVTRTPVASTSPPLYAPLALPFSLLGWPGLVALEVLAFVLAGALVHRMAALHARRASTAWLALGTYLLASYSVEYAQGMWPHALSSLLVAAALYCAMRLRSQGRLGWAGASGLLIGVAAGVRYLNLAIALTLGAGLVLWAAGRRARAALLFTVCLLVPLGLCSAMNAARLGSWNPVSKGPSYLAVSAGAARGGVLAEGLTSTWARVVDFSAWQTPARTRHEQEAWFSRDPSHGGYVLIGAVKKAWLQSAPWLATALAGLLLAWSRRGAFGAGARRELRAISLVCGGILGLFALVGFRRSDALCFNQRYFLELMPGLAVAFAWIVESLEAPRRALLLAAAGAAGGLGLLLALDLPPVARYRLLAWAPLLVAALGPLLWIARRRGRLLAAVLGAGLGWAAAAHLGDDLVASRRLRAANEARLRAIDAGLPGGERAAYFAWWGDKDALAPLLLERDLVILDPWIDHGADAPRLVDAALEDGRRVYFQAGIPLEIARRMVADHPFVEVIRDVVRVFRIDAGARGTPAPTR